MDGPFRCIYSCFVALVFVVSSTASAIELNPDGQGDVVILPVFAATEQVSTLLTINNTDRLVPKAVRVRFRDRDGVELLAFNLYLGRYDTWSASITRVGTEVRLQFTDASCTVATGVDGATALPASVALGSAYGFVEIFEMGAIAIGDGTNGALIEARECETLVQAWRSGPWFENPLTGVDPPGGSVRATASVINVPKGTLYTIPGTALRGFSDVAQHTLPDDTSPNLASGRDEGTELGSTRALVCQRSGCEFESFATPLEAVEAVLMVHELTADYSISPGLGAKSELVLTYPTRHFRPQPPSSTEIQYNLYLLDRDRDPSSFTACTPPGGFQFEFDFCITPGIGNTFQHDRSVELLSFINRTAGNEEPQFVSSAILGMDHELVVPASRAVAPNGMAMVGFDTLGQGTLSSSSGSRLYGQPAIGVMLQEVTNAVLVSDDGVQQRANYGGAVVATRTSHMRDN